MKEVNGNIWSYWQDGYVVVIPTNLQVRRNGTAVMGAGLALQAAENFPGLDFEYGIHLLSIDNNDNGSLYISHAALFLLPTKNHWKDGSDISLIENGLRVLVKWYNNQETKPSVALPRLGCGLGGLKWEEVKPLCAKWLTSDNFVVVSP